MGLSRCARAKSFLLFLILFGIAISDVRGTRIHAQQPVPSQRWDGLIELISGRYPWTPPTTEPQIPADGPSEMTGHAISGDGRYIVFNTNAPSFNYGDMALYMRDRQTNETRLLLGGPALEAVISADGNHVAYKLCDPWMRPDQQPICDVYSLDLRTWAWTLISESMQGEHGDADSGAPVISADGRFVVFQTSAVNILRRSSLVKQLVLRDRDPDGNGTFDEPGTPVNDIISEGFNGSLGNGESTTPEVSDDGRYVAFRSIATNLSNPGGFGTWNVYRRDRHAHRTLRINLRPDGSPSPASITSPAIAMSANGQVIAFTSDDPYLTWGHPDDYNNTSDVFVYDELADPLIKRIDIGEGWPIAQGYLPGNGPAEWPSISADGRYVAFQSKATNVAAPVPPPGSTQIYVFDRATGTPTRISVKPDGSDPDDSSTRPSISADGSLVAFMSPALNLARNVQTPIDRIYAAVHFEVTPAEIFAAGSGGQGTFTVTTQQHTQWWVDWSTWTSWMWFESPPMGVGSGSLSVRVPDANPDPTPRTAVIRIHDKEVKFTQLGGLSITSVSPSQGPSAGGTVVTIRGTGFEPGVQVDFGGYRASSVELVDSTTILATTPPHEVGPFWVGVFSADYNQFAWLDQAFRFLDGTPPEIWSSINGNVGGDGWYTSDATVGWWFWDEETEVTASSSCVATTVTTDTPGTTFTCTATSEGGTSSASVTVKRDTTPPAIEVVTPRSTIYELNSTVIPEITCQDGMSGVAQCGEVPTQSPLDTSYSGWHTYNAFALDRAGNYGYTTAEYAVSTGVCTPTTPELKLWFMFEGTGKDSVHGSPQGGAWPQHVASEYTQGKVGQALVVTDWRFFNFGHQLSDLNFTSAMTFAAWIRADGQDGEAGVIASKEDQFRIARFADGTIRWAFNNDSPGYEWVNTGAVMPQGVWTHLAVTYDNGVVKTYINGRLAHTHQGSGPIRTLTGLPYWAPWVTLGNRHDPAHKSALIGAIDEAQFLDVVWEPALVEASFFAGAQGMCRLTTTVTIAALATGTYGNPTFVARAQLREGASQIGIAGRTLRFESYVSQWNAFVGAETGVTDADGWATVNLPISPTAQAGTYNGPAAFRVYFNSDLQYGGSQGSGELTLLKATPVITWATPAPITYGTPLGVAQMNATANLPGVFWYSHFSGTVLPPGTHTLSVTFDPDNWNYNNATAAVTLEVRKATPVLTWNQPAAIVYGTALGASQLNATASVPGGWSYAPAAGTVLNGGAAQTLIATFTPTDTSKYDVASVTTTIDVAKATPTISVSSITYGYDAQPHPAIASAVGVARENLEPIVVTYNGSSDVPVNAGTYDVVASFAGNANYNAASQTATITITKAQPSIVATGGSYTYDGSAHPAAATATGVNGAVLGPVTFTYNGSETAPVNAGTYNVVATFAGDVNYNAVSTTCTVTIAKATASLTWTQPAPIVYGTVLGPSLFSATSTVPGTFTYAPDAGTLLNAGNGQTLTATFVPSDTTNYSGGSVSTTIDVAKATPAVIIAGGSYIYDGTPHPAGAAGTGALGEELVPLTFSYNGSASAPVNAGTYEAVATFAGNNNYVAVSASATITIAKAPLGLNWTEPGAIVYGTALGATQLNAVANVAGSFSYSPAAGTVLNAGAAHALTATFTPADPINYDGGVVSTTINVAKATPAISVTGGSFTYDGTPHAASATATGVGGESLTPVTVTYNGSANLPVNAGNYLVAASYAGSANYVSASETTPLTIGKAAAVISWPAPSAIVYGTALGAAHLNASANVAGSFSYSPSAGTVLNAGNGQTLAVLFTPVDSANYTGASISTTVNVARAPLTVRANDAVKPFGAPVPAFVASAIGFVNGDSFASLGGAIAFATTATQQSAVGVYAIVPSGVTSPNYAIAFVNGTLAIVRGSTAVSVSASPEPSGNGEAMTFSATVTTVAPAAGQPTGTVRFFDATDATDGGTLIGSAVLSAGQASLTTAGLDPGLRTIEARYDGDASFDTATGTAQHLIQDAAGTPVISISSSRNPSNLGQTVTLTANVNLGAGTVSGTIEFYDGATLIGTAAISAGRATLTTSALAAGSHAITARYVGVADIPPSRSGVFVQAVGGSGWKDRATTTTLTSSPNPSVIDAPVVLTADVIGSSSVMPNGRVLFMIDGEVVGDPSGVAVTPLSGTTARATFTVTGLKHGRHKVTATYLGESTYKGSTAAITQTVN